MKNAIDLIKLSISENRTVTGYPTTRKEFDNLCADLLVECSDDCDPIEHSGSGYSGPESRGWFEFWAENWKIDIINPQTE